MVVPFDHWNDRNKTPKSWRAAFFGTIQGFEGGYINFFKCSEAGQKMDRFHHRAIGFLHINIYIYIYMYI